MTQPSDTAKGASERAELSRLRSAAARRTAEAKATMPHLVATTVNQWARPIDSPGALLAAVAAALRAVPDLNAAYVDGGVERFARVNVAVALPGPVAPVLVDADTRAGDELAAAVEAARARDAGEFTARDLAGATFTVHGLGVEGLASLTPILVPRQAGALGMGHETLTLVADARVVDAATAGAFLTRLGAALK